jgi:hypothetical protein
MEEANMRIAIFGLSLCAAFNLTHITYAEAPKESDVSGVIASYPMHGAEHHALVERADGETLDTMMQRAFTECGDAHCRILTVLQKGDCLSLVKGKTYVYWNWNQNDMGKTREQATEACTRSSESCQLERSMCFAK